MSSLVIMCSCGYSIGMNQHLLSASDDSCQILMYDLSSDLKQLYCAGCQHCFSFLLLQYKVKNKF